VHLLQEFGKKKTMVKCVSLKRKIKVLNNNKTFLEFNNLEVGWAFITFGTCSNYTIFKLKVKWRQFVICWYDCEKDWIQPLTIWLVCMEQHFYPWIWRILTINIQFLKAIWMYGSFFLILIFDLIGFWEHIGGSYKSCIWLNF
jgi:hypothetical protein